MSVNFLACAIGPLYESFLVPFTLFALEYSDDSFVEIVVADSDRFKKAYATELAMLRKYHTEFKIRNFKHGIGVKHIANTYRFFEAPTVIKDYTYIPDIDIMYTSDVVDSHKNLWSLMGTLPYYNIVRNNYSENRLTGLHLVKTADYFTPEFIKVQEKHFKGDPRQHRKLNDEVVLYAMCKDYHGVPSRENQIRPIPGIHFSPNRGKGKRIHLLTYKSMESAFNAAEAKYPELFSQRIFRTLSKSLRDDFHVV
jgi:hypothetical protein